MYSSTMKSPRLLTRRSAGKVQSHSQLYRSHEVSILKFNLLNDWSKWEWKNSRTFSAWNFWWDDKSEKDFSFVCRTRLIGSFENPTAEIISKKSDLRSSFKGVLQSYHEDWNFENQTAKNHFKKWTIRCSSFKGCALVVPRRMKL